MTENSQAQFKEFEKEYNNTKDLNEKFKIFRKYNYFLDTYDIYKTLFYIDDLIQISKSTKDPKTEHILYFFKSNCLQIMGQNDKALRLMLTSKEYFFSVGDFHIYYKALSDISLILANLGQIHHAIYLWKEVLSFSNNDLDHWLNHTVLINLIYASLITYQKFDNTEKHINELLQYYEEHDMLNHIIYCKANANMGVYCLKSKKQYKEAIHFLDKALHIAIELKEVDAQFEIYLLLAECHDILQDEKKMMFHLNKARLLFSDNKKFTKAIPLYNRLYTYYKSKEDFNNALKYHEMSLTLELYKKEQQKEINKTLNKLGIDSVEKSNLFILDEYASKHLFNFNRDIFLENSKGTLVKINIDSIVYVESSAKMIKIHFVDKTSFIFKASMKEFSDLIHEKFSNDHLFFNTNLRNEMVNLFWMSKFDKLNKKLYVNVLGDETSFEVTRTQTNVLRDFLKI
jgi:tetratricopeptide (TPR) repeat protein